MIKPPNRAPAFSTESEERTFWEHNDSTEYVDWSAAEKVALPNLKLSDIRQSKGCMKFIDTLRVHK
jgi:hypothetical protein